MDILTLRAIGRSAGAETLGEAAKGAALERIARDTQNSVNRKPCKVNGKPRSLLITDDGSLYKCKAISFPGESLDFGDIVAFDGAAWIVCDNKGNVAFQQVSTLFRCNHTLKFQLPGCGCVFERVCVLDSGNYSTAQKGNSHMQELNRQMRLYARADEAAKRIPIGARLAFGDLWDTRGERALNCFEVTAYDRVSGSRDGKQGYLTLMLGSSQYNPETDSLRLGVCDYRESGGREAAGIRGETRVRTGMAYRYALRDPDAIPAWAASAEWARISPDGLLEVPDDERLVGAKFAVVSGTDSLEAEVC
jgi:hypothetical protein